MKTARVERAPDARSQTEWHDKPLGEVFAAFGTSPLHGLSQEEAAKRLAEAGPNELREGEAVSPYTILANQFQSLVIWVLIGAGVVSMALAEFTDGVALIAIVVLNAALCFFQEYRGQKMFLTLEDLIRTAPN